MNTYYELANKLAKCRIYMLRGWECSSMTEHVLSMQEALGSILKHIHTHTHTQNIHVQIPPRAYRKREGEKT
jgi:hypothetical protein